MKGIKDLYCFKLYIVLVSLSCLLKYITKYETSLSVYCETPLLVPPHIFLSMYSVITV